MSSATPAPPAAAATAPANGDAVPFIRRQPIVNEAAELYGYELFNGNAVVGGAYTAASDAALLFNALSYVGEESLVGEKTVFVNCTHESLAGGHLELIHPDRVVLEISTLPAGTPVAEIEARVGVFNVLRQRGFRLAFDQTLLQRAYASWLPLASFIKLDMLGIPEQNLPTLIKFAQTYTAAQLVAERLETPAQFELMKSLGVRLFQGYLFGRPEAVSIKTRRPAHAAITRLLQLARSQSNEADIEAMLKKDPLLSFYLLRLIQTSGLSTSADGVTSLRQAIAALGIKKLFRWAALLLSTSRETDTAQALSAQAIVRARLMQLLAAERFAPDLAEQAFLVGQFSLLDNMLGLRLAQVLEALPLPPAVVEALLYRRGMFAPYLEMTLACESGEPAAFAQAGRALGLTNHAINWAHLQALAWAHTGAGPQSVR